MRPETLEAWRQGGYRDDDCDDDNKDDCATRVGEDPHSSIVQLNLLEYVENLAINSLSLLSEASSVESLLLSFSRCVVEGINVLLPDGDGDAGDDDAGDDFFILDKHISDVLCV